MTPTNMGSFSGSYSYVSPSTSFTSPGNQSGHVSFDRVSSRDKTILTFFQQKNNSLFVIVMFIILMKRKLT